MKITTKQYRKINNDRELGKSKKTLKRYFNLYIRLRGFGRKGTSETQRPIIEGECIACGKTLSLELFSDNSIMNGRDHHASHFHNTDKYPNLEYYEDNCWLSCNRCNSPLGLHGNKTEYLPNLLKKIGKKRFEAMERLRHQIYKPDILEIDRMCFEYRDKSKAEARRLGVKI